MTNREDAKRAKISFVSLISFAFFVVKFFRCAAFFCL